MYIEIYSKTTCPHCQIAENTIKSKNIPYKKFLLDKGEATKDDIQNRVKNMGLSTVIATVPQIFYRNKQGQWIYIGGNDQLQKQLHVLGT